MLAAGLDVFLSGIAISYYKFCSQFFFGFCDLDPSHFTSLLNTVMKTKTLFIMLVLQGYCSRVL